MTGPVRLDRLLRLHSDHLTVEALAWLETEGVRLYPIVQRYVWPSEMDLMARIAGLRLLERWAGWDRRPVTASSTNLVSVYGR